MILLGVDLAWGEGSATRPAKETGLVALTATGEVVAAGWCRGLDAVVAWVTEVVGDARDVLVAVDAPLVVTDETGQRACETQVGQRYGRWRVSANTTNRRSPRLAGVALLARLEALGFAGTDGWDGPPREGRWAFECYPYTTLVGVAELGYDVERPRYKRKPKALRAAEFRPLRAQACAELVRRLARLETADPPLRLGTHPETAALLDGPVPLADVPYKHREDLLDAAVCAWTASLWHRHGLDRCQVLGEPEGPGRAATIIAPARPEQRR